VQGIGLPAIYEARVLVERGGLISYGPDLNEAFRRAASYADRILRGAKPLTFRSNDRSASSWRSISKSPKRSASLFRSRCSPAPTR
jgi:hypothetical protein